MHISDLTAALGALADDKRLLGEIVEGVRRENEIRREIDELTARLPKLRSALADQEKAVGMLKAERQRLHDEIVRVENLLAAR